MRGTQRPNETTSMRAKHTENALIRQPPLQWMFGHCRGLADKQPLLYAGNLSAASGSTSGALANTASNFSRLPCLARCCK